MPIHHKSRLLNHANCSYTKVIPHMQCAFQAASQQLDTWLLWNSLRSKVEGSYFDSWPLLDFFKMWSVPGFRSAGHIILLFDFRLPYIQENPEMWQKMFFYLLECSNSELLQACTKAEARPLTSIDFWPIPIRLSKKFHLFNQQTTNCNCVVCSGETRHTTSYYCTNCPEEPALY